ncbi:MAG: helix-turn-helix domain-containing protein [Akkermansia sp.]
MAHQKEIKANYNCALLLSMDLLGGKWKMRLLWHILHGDDRFSKLQRAIPDITTKMLITQLRELERSGLLVRTEYPEVPPRVVYHLAEQYHGLIPIVESFCDFGKEYAEINGVALGEVQKSTV